MAPPKRKRSSNANAHDSDGEGDRDGDFVAEEGYAEGNVSNESAVLPHAECPFTVVYKTAKKPPKGKKAKRHKTELGTSGPPPHQDLDQEPPEDTTVFIVKPKKQWDSLKKYRNFVVGTENFALNEYIFVAHEQMPQGFPDLPDVDEQKFWVARVLEIRAIDEAHVYLRVYWLYWPEELPGGRQPYHGQKELVASNHMDIIDAMTVSGRAHVKHWLELDEDEDLPDLFWRQKFDFPSQTLMEVREHCKCHQYYNPDKLMYGCPHCKTWLHEECVQEDIKRKAFAKVLAEEGEEAVRAALEAIHVDAPTPAPPEPKAAGPKKRGRKPGAGAAAKNGKGNNGTKTSTEGSVEHPTVEQLDQMFEVVITVNTGGQATRALVKDMRPVKKADGEEEVAEEEEEEEEAEENEDEEEEEGGNANTGKKKKRKPRRVWEEDVVCLLCSQVIY